MGSIITQTSKKITDLFPNPNKLTYQWVHTPFVNIFDSSMLNSRIKDCAWKASHNSVVGDIQIFGPASINIFARVLNQGVRVIELDLHESLETKGLPVVSHGNLEDNLQVTPAVELEEICKFIKDYAWMDTNEPLIIFLEMNIESRNFQVLENIRLIFEKHLRGFLYKTDKYKFVGDIPLYEIFNSCLIIPSLKSSVLDPIAQTTLYGSGQFHNRSSNEVPFTDETRLIRIYAANIILSNNPDADPFLKKKNQFVCLNWTYDDANLRKFKRRFGRRGILPFKNLNFD